MKRLSGVIFVVVLNSYLMITECVYLRVPKMSPKAEFVYLGVPKVSLKHSLCISESPKCP